MENEYSKTKMAIVEELIEKNKIERKAERVAVLKSLRQSNEILITLINELQEKIKE